jgi:mannan endo-1,4-beta-mannosidase
MRIWAFSIVEQSPMQVAPGVYNETLFSGLDWVLAEAGKRSLHVSLVLCDFWKYAGGVRQYVDWAGAPTTSDFFSVRHSTIYTTTCGSLTFAFRTPCARRCTSRTRLPSSSDETLSQACCTGADSLSFVRNRRSVVRSFIAALLTLASRDDPAIWGWELLNEPVCTGCAPLLQSWVDEMAAFVAQADSNHIRTVGEEGFWQWFANRCVSSYMRAPARHICP